MFEHRFKFQTLFKESNKNISLLVVVFERTPLGSLWQNLHPGYSRNGAINAAIRDASVQSGNVLFLRYGFRSSSNSDGAVGQLKEKLC